MLYTLNMQQFLVKYEITFGIKIQMQKYSSIVVKKLRITKI